MRFVATIFVAATLVSAGCAQKHQAAPAPLASVDSLEGIVAIVGTDFDRRLVIRSSRDMYLVAEGSDSAALARVAGTQIRVRGTPVSADAIRVGSFLVLRVDGKPVVDGVLVENAGRFFVRTEEGLKSLGNPPAAFSALTSARVWIGGPLDTGPNTYGLISPAVFR